MRLVNRTPYTLTIVQPVCPRCGLPRTSFEPDATGAGAPNSCPHCGKPRAVEPPRDGIFIRIPAEPPPILVDEIEPEPVAGNFGVALVEARGWCHESTTAAATDINRTVEANDGLALVMVSRTVLDALAQPQTTRDPEARRAIEQALLAAATPDTSPGSAVRDDDGQITGVRRLMRRAPGHAHSVPE